VKLLDDDTKKINRTNLHWSDIGGMEELKQELIQTVQWRFEVNDCLDEVLIE
jgi:SpoVK/Ycf46/Vps4 family AAA+-type ATPase